MKRRFSNEGSEDVAGFPNHAIQVNVTTSKVGNKIVRQVGFAHTGRGSVQEQSVLSSPKFVSRKNFAQPRGSAASGSEQKLSQLSQLLTQKSLQSIANRIDMFRYKKIIRSKLQLQNLQKAPIPPAVPSVQPESPLQPLVKEQVLSQRKYQTPNRRYDNPIEQGSLKKRDVARILHDLLMVSVESSVQGGGAQESRVLSRRESIQISKSMFPPPSTQQRITGNENDDHLLNVPFQNDDSDNESVVLTSSLSKQQLRGQTQSVALLPQIQRPLKLSEEINQQFTSRQKKGRVLYIKPSKQQDHQKFLPTNVVSLAESTLNQDETPLQNQYLVEKVKEMKKEPLALKEPRIELIRIAKNQSPPNFEVIQRFSVPNNSKSPQKSTNGITRDQALRYLKKLKERYQTQIKLQHTASTPTIPTPTELQPRQMINQNTSANSSALIRADHTDSPVNMSQAMRGSNYQQLFRIGVQVQQRGSRSNPKVIKQQFKGLQNAQTRLLGISQQTKYPFVITNQNYFI
ncbi:hypothetical protein FGO68_gene3224 [Halteria grandinella]|uniref:Uncharacterized protein n=1 Tax=Halteria grandinella TaxID=5974 RepID=A0A8J8NTD4_HALGN|nr:hypothetical protein FGO68_gene3224 [Halteria grandinella]